MGEPAMGTRGARESSFQATRYPGRQAEGDSWEHHTSHVIMLILTRSSCVFFFLILPVSNTPMTIILVQRDELRVLDTLCPVDMRH